MDELPELPFELVLSYLNLEDRLKARAVSRRWYHKINSLRVNTLCFSEIPIGRILRKLRWVSGAFAENFIRSTRFASFFDTSGQTILSNLKHLRLCDIDLNEGDRAAFARILNSFSQLERLDIIRAKLNQQEMFNLPMLTSLQLEDVEGIQKLTLEAPRLREVKILGCHSYVYELSVEIVHGESVERLLVEQLEYTEVKKLKNLQQLYMASLSDIDPTFLSSLQQLKEIHTNEPDDVSELFEQKQRSGRADLKIYLCGLLLNGPDDPTRNAFDTSCFDYLTRESFVCLAENPSRLADQIPFYRSFDYSDIEGVAPGLEVDLLKRFTDLNEVEVQSRVQDIEGFLNLLKNCEKIVEFEFCDEDQRQDLFDRLPEHSAVQWLEIEISISDLDFLFRLKHLIHLDLYWSIDKQTVRRAFEELPALSSFWFQYAEQRTSIKIGHSKQVHVSVGEEKKTFNDLNAAIEFIVEFE